MNTKLATLKSRKLIALVRSVCLFGCLHLSRDVQRTKHNYVVLRDSLRVSSRKWLALNNEQDMLAQSPEFSYGYRETSFALIPS